MKLLLNSICEGMYNPKQLHAFIQIKDAEDLTALEPFEYRAYLNEKVLPVLKANFKSQSHTMDEFVYDSQGAPLSLLIRSNNSSNNTAVLFKSMDTCIKSSNQFFNPKEGFFAVPVAKEESSEEEANLSATI
jgi:hypothetical protein